MTSDLQQSRHFFVINPVCFYNTLEMEKVIGEIHRFFETPDTTGKTPDKAPKYAVHISRFPRDAKGAIRRFADAVPANTPLRVYAVGGDGILFDCLNGTVGLPNAELGVLPYGRKNAFHRIFGRNNKVFCSLEAQTAAPSVPMNVLYCGSNYALSCCLVGLESL
ncbi:MAG: hypothetical protein LBU45_08775, partial [Azoarcus sp.]|nr:hypothetical protein [Azoarcus sp.]